MALAFKSVGTVFKSGTGAASTFTANVPTSVAPASGDLLIAVGVDWAGSGVTWTTPTGWSVVRNDNDGATGDIGVHTYSKIAGSSEANQNFTLSVAENGVMVMLCYSGQDATSAIDVSGASVTDPAAASNTLTTPVVTTTVANDLLLLIYALSSDNNGSSTSPVIPTPATTTNRVATTGQNSSPSGTWVLFSIDEVAQASAGASAQFSSASTGNGTATYGAAAITVAIKAGATGAALTGTVVVTGSVGGGLNTTFLFPASDVSAGSWTTNSGATTGLYAMLDEATPSDADYDQSSESPASDVLIVALGSGAAPNAGPQILHYRYGKDMLGGRPVTLTVDLMQGATVVQTWTHTDIPDGWTQADQTVTGTITDYTTLRLRFTAS